MRALVFLIFAALFAPALRARAQNQAVPPPAYATNLHLPVVSIVVTQQVVSEIKVPCTIRLQTPSGSHPTNTQSWPAVIRIHGASSQGYPKKSLAFTLNQASPLLGMNNGSQWVLNAAYVDRSLMRHKLSYDLFRSLASTNQPRFAAASRFVEVWLNHRYQGAYLLMERVDSHLLGFQPFNPASSNHACLYKAIDHSANFTSPGFNGFEQRDPDPVKKPYWPPLEDFNRFVSRSPNPRFFHPQSGIASRLDLANTIDFHLLILLTSNMDGFDKNFLLGRDAPSPRQPEPKFFFVPWDYDATFGRNWEGSRVHPSAWLSNALFDRLLSQDAYRTRFAARWRQLRSQQFSVANLEQMMDENMRTLGDAAKRNSQRWHGGPNPAPGRRSPEEDLAQMKQWIRARASWLDSEIAERTGSQPAPR